MKDGSSNTILRVAVAPQRAVPWTQPTDWQVDLEHPLRGLVDGQRKKIAYSRADGSTDLLRVTIAPEALRAAITADGGEIIDSNDFK